MCEIGHLKLCTDSFELPGRTQVAAARGIREDTSACIAVRAGASQLRVFRCSASPRITRRGRGADDLLDFGFEHGLLSV
jgi:hypothetical protein